VKPQIIVLPLKHGKVTKVAGTNLEQSKRKLGLISFHKSDGIVDSSLPHGKRANRAEP
jgi:hypothetical protein